MDSKLQDKMDFSGKNTLSRLLALLFASKALLLLTLFVRIELSQANQDHIEEALSNHHLSWTQNTTRYDLVFNVHGPIQSFLKLESDSNNYLTKSLANCTGHSACFFRNGTLLDHFQSSTPQRDSYSTIHKSVYISDRKTTVEQKPGQCYQNNFTILHYCSTHWNPPAYLHKIKCSHTIEWHSPLTCHTNSTNYERPCYIYDPKGNLIDLTPYARSDGSSYKVNATYATVEDVPYSKHFNHSKGFYINVCNEAYDMCGPNISACFMDNDQGGLIEAGYNNLTSIRYDTKENVVLLTSQGHFKEQCENSRIKTVIRFTCKKPGSRISDVVGPKLIRMDGCANVIEWSTAYACPLSEIKAPVLPDCKIRYEPLGIDMDVRQMTNNATTVQVTDVGAKNQTMILGLCKALPKSFKCEGKVNSATSACLFDSEDKSSEKSAKKSQVIGSIGKSTLRFAEDRLYLESSAVNKTCSTLVDDTRGGFNVTRQIGYRLEFMCSSKETQAPKYLGFEDCTYIFEWGTPRMCLESMYVSVKGNSSIQLDAEVVIGSVDVDLSPKPPTSDDIARKTASELHKDTLADSSNMSDPFVSHDEHHHQQPPALTSPKTSETTAKPAQSKPSNAQAALGGAQKPKMNVMHKFFMISIIIMSLVAFLVIILVLDKKTRLRIPIGSIRRQTRSSFQTQTVPYSRVVNDLDL